MIMTVYLEPNLSRGNVELYLERAMVEYDNAYKIEPFIMVGDFNVDNYKTSWTVEHMISRYSLRCISHDNKTPTTIRGTCMT